MSMDVTNIDIVLTVESIDGKFVLREYRTGVPRDVVETLKMMVSDPTRTLIDMQNEAIRHLPPRAKLFFNYLAPLSYSESYVTGITYPKRKTEQEYKCLIRDEESCIKQDFERRLKADYPVGRYGQKWRTIYFEKVNAEVKRRMDEYTQRLKWGYFHAIRRYIYAWYYDHTIVENKIVERLNFDLKMYSTDTHGFTHFKYPVSEDVLIGLHTNFGYGIAAYFRIELTYKGVPILPYSLYVNYYYANSRELSLYTRVYEERRESWRRAFKFVVDTVNLATENPERFIREWVMNEVVTMVDGLRRIFSNPEAYIGKWLSAVSNVESESPYLHVRMMDGAAAATYECYPWEMSIDFMAKKISGALDFLAGLKLLKPIFPEVDAQIVEIKRIAISALPQMETAVVEISNDLKRLNIRRIAWLKRIGGIDKRLGLMNEEVCRLYTAEISEKQKKFGYLNSDKRNNLYVRILSLYEESHEGYGMHKRAKSWCEAVVTKIESDIRARKKFKDSISTCLLRIKGDG